VIARPLVQVWDATGTTALGVLAGFTSLTISDVFCDLGSLALETPRDTAGASLLDVDEDRQLRLSWPGTSSPVMWFVNDDDSSTWVSDDPGSEPLKLTCRSLAQLLDEAVVLPPGGVGTTPTDYTFTTKTPGYIVNALFTQAQGQGWLQGLTLTGSATLDAAGAAWPVTVPTAAYKTGTSLLSVLKGLASAGLIEWRLNGRALEVYKLAGGLDRALTSVLRPRRDVLAAPLTRTRRAVTTDVVIEGSSSATALRTQTLTGRRKRAKYLSQSSVPSGSLNTVGDLYLAAHDTADLQMTHDLTDGDTTPVPWVDYRPGDRILTVAAGAGVTSRRIQQVALAMTATDTKATLELGSLLKTAEEQFAQRLAQIAPGDTTLTA
jgi:hypothetical protein